MPDFYATCPQGLENLLVRELTDLGLTQVRGTRGGAHFRSADLDAAYRLCLWSQLCHRLLLNIAQFHVTTPDEVYQAVRAIDWSEHLRADGRLLVEAKLRDTQLGNAHFIALKVKDAIADQFREACGERPSVDTRDPDLRLNLFVHRAQAQLAIDLSGGGLRRGGGEDAHWRGGLGAAALYFGDWPARLQRGEPLMILGAGDADVLGSAALMSSGGAPGLSLPHFGFERWLGHVPALWRRLREAAQAARQSPQVPPIQVWDEHRQSLHQARTRCEQAGWDGLIQWHSGELSELQAPPGPGLLLLTAPTATHARAREDFARRSEAVARQAFAGWTAVQLGLGAEADAQADWSLAPDQVLSVFRGKSGFRLRRFTLPPIRILRPQVAPQPVAAVDTAGGQMVLNRLRKNYKHLGKWARRTGVSCYRLYDADLPEYAAAVDLYQSDLLWAVVQEYAPPAKLDPQLAAQRLDDIVAAVAQLLDLPAQRVIVKQRRRQRGASQYEKLDRRDQAHIVTEAGLKLWVNFTDYLDTGLFLDHRDTRIELGQRAAGKHVLNLFAYTGVATVHMVAGGARSSTTVDMSKTYLDWAQRNLLLNGLDGQAHRFVQADCLRWLDQAVADPAGKRYGLIFMDPPTFSSSKRMDDVLDVQRDHVRLIQAAATLLRPGGELYFSNNFRRFRMDAQALAELAIEDISARSIPEDFRRNPRIHQCYRITRR